ncbi:MAG: CoA transferase [Hyphomicrobiaceae bacterium]|nr:CoA transferase [Hyphomicrobiaceae bacterium]
MPDPTPNVHANGLPSNLPLYGIRVLDLASYIAAPVAATVMADYGATVIKVEPPNGGDPNRSIRQVSSYPPSAVNYPWEMDSRGKRSIAINLQSESGRQALYRLIKSTDVLVTNSPPLVRRRLKIDYDDVKNLNPKLIYAAFTGYGEAGPDRDHLGFDSTAYFARSGLSDCNRYEDQPPGPAQPAQGDRASGISLLAGIMMALWSREKTGTGTLVTSSLLANGLWANGVAAQAALLGSTLPPRPPRHRPRNAVTNPYLTRDKRWLQLTMVREDTGWTPFCKALGKPELEHDPRFATPAARRTNAADLVAQLDAVFASNDWAHWRDKLREAGTPVGLIGIMSDLRRDEQATACGAVVTTDNPSMPLTLAAPFGLASAPIPPAKPAPALGEHTDAVLLEAGFNIDEIATMRTQGGVA